MTEGAALFFLSFCLLFDGGFAANAALLKNVTAEPSCGVNSSELYYNITQAILLPFLRNISICDQSTPEFAHPPQAMVDGSLFTFWQTKGSEDKARITIDLSGPHQKFYYVKTISIYFGDYYRPEQIAFYKKSSIESSNFAPWHYLVTEHDECERKFGVGHQEIPAAPNSTLCSTYERPAEETDETVKVEFQGGRGRIVDNDNNLNLQLLDWMNTSVVEIRFSGLHLFLDRLASRWQHYVVNEVEITAYCDCNGHADGMNCPYDSGIGDRTCECQEGSCGSTCDSCCPAYHQYPYKRGAKGPFIKDEGAACEKCNCYDHSDVCVYNETVANNNCTYGNKATNDECSLDIHGKYSGGGVCVNCQDHTEGINCQRCITGYFRESGKSHRNKDACQPCDCHENGTRNVTLNGIQAFDCVRDDDEAADVIGLNPGDCLCKNKTTGRRCDRCLDGYYNLTAENPEGCLDCNCHRNGTVNGSITCDDEGVCSCKIYVDGTKCDHCKKGTFNLANANRNGCTTCVCSGITSNCTSSSAFISETSYDVKGWKLTRDLDSSQILPVMNIQEDLNGQTVDMISANVTTGQSLYWLADEEYFRGRSLVDSYGGSLVFTRKVSSVINGTLELHPQVILKGPRNVTVRQFLPPAEFGSPDPLTLSVKMVELNWTHLDSSKTVNRSTFMLVLSKPNKMWITASYFTSGPGTYQTSLGNIRLSSVSNIPTSNGLAVEVEQCFCGQAYQGSSCERCARGYHRVNVTEHPFFGVCVPCNCHGHTPDCDPDTGECLQCQHNTTGFNCQLCKDGFYGEARNGTSEDCKECPCEPPRTATDLCSLLPNGSAQCLNCSEGYEENLKCDRCELGYFGRPDIAGGNCSLCHCNNNSDVCDRETGSCLGYCGNNATGWHCERCENGTYGNALRQQCRACTCDVTGSYDEPCDHRSGQCHCKPNVQGFNCSLCDVNSYGFGDTGCQQCGCNEFGSVSLQCNNSGVCECKNFTYGDKCSACVDNYYGLPNMTCQDCACNSTGSNDTICDHVTGECPCKSGVEGRQCDRCQKQHKDFSSSGCEPCPRCTMKLQGRVDEAAYTLSSSERDAKQADESIDYYPQLEDIEKEIPIVQALQETHNNRLKKLEEYRLQLSNVTLNTTITELEEREKMLTLEADDLTSRMSVEIDRNRNISALANSAFDYAVFLNQTTRVTIGELEERVTQATAMNSTSSSAVRLSEERISNASAQEDRGNKISVTVQERLLDAENARNEVQTQREEMEKLIRSIDLFNRDFDDIRKEIEKGLLVQNTTQGDIDNIKALVDQVNNTIVNTDELLRQASVYINNSNKLTFEGTVNYKRVENTSLPELVQKLDELKTAMSDVNDSLTLVDVLVNNASLHGQKLTAKAEELKQNFSAARRHGEKAVASIDRYDEITRRINNSIELANQANEALNELIGRISNLSRTSQDLNLKVSKCQKKGAELLSATKARNLNIPELGLNVSRAYQTLAIANETCNRVGLSKILMDSKSPQVINVTAVQRPLITTYIRNSSSQALETLNLSRAIERGMVEQKERLNLGEEKLSAVNSLVINATEVGQETVNTVNKTDLLLLNITRSTNASRQILQENTQTQQNLTARMKTLEAKLKSAKEKVAKFRLAMQLRGNTSVKLRPTQRVISNPLLNMISLDFKTNFSTGLLLYMAPNPNSTRQSVSLKLVTNRVRFSYNLGSSPVVITNWEVPVADNMWHRIYATRYREIARLTVTNLQTGFFRTYEGPKRIFSDLEMEFNNNSSVFLGGLPTDQKVNFTEKYFDGDLDNLVVNEERVSIWDPVAVEGVRRFTAVRRPAPEMFDSCVTFHGNGFIQQLAGTFETRTNSSLSFQFRSFFKEADMVIAEGKDKELIYKISLSNGGVIFQYNTTTLRSAHSHYSDGQWYHVHVTRTLKNASLHITPLSRVSNKPNDYVSTNRSLPLYLADVEYVYFGGKNQSGNRFAGGMKLVSLSSNITSSLTRRNLTDENFTVYSAGVQFDKCLSTVEPGLRYFNGYTALLTNNTAGMSSLSIRFKSSKPSGLLAYSMNEESRFYLALFHGNIFMMYSNGTANELLLQTKTETLNDGAYHSVEITIGGSSVEMKVDAPSGEYVSQNLPVGLSSPVPLRDLLYIGGTPSSITIPTLVPVLRPFTGDIHTVVLNGNTTLEGSSAAAFESAISEGVSAAGVSPSAQLSPTPLPTNTPAPPTCAAKYPEKSRSEKQQEVQFQGVDSVLGLSPERRLLNGMRSSFVIVLEFRALSPNGLLFLAVNNATNTSQFVSLELVDGKLVYKFNTGSGLVQMKTEGNYAIGGLWYTVNLLRIGQFGAIVVPQNKEYHKDLRDDQTGQRLVVDSVFIGGIHGDVNTSMLENPSAPSFFGCIRELSIQTVSENKLFNLSGEAVASQTRNVHPGQCYDYVQPQVGFDGSGYAKLRGVYNLSDESEITIRFRTTERNGLLFVAMDTMNNSNMMVLEQADGQIVLSYKHATEQTRLEWTDPTLNSSDPSINLNSSYALCNNIYHTVNVKRSLGLVQLDVNNENKMSMNTTHDGILATVYVGGVPSGLHMTVGDTGRRLVGCVESVHVNGHVIDFRHELAEHRSMEFGCRAPIEPSKTYSDFNPLQVFTLV